MAWYHLWEREPEKALFEWNQLVKGARRKLRMSEHYRLLGWWSATGLLERKPGAMSRA